MPLFPPTATFSQSLQTQMTGLTGGMSTQGNTAGTTGLVSHQILFVGSNNISLSQSVNAGSATLSFFGPSPSGGGAVSFSGGTSSAALASLVFSDSNGVSFGLNGSTLTGSVSQSVQTQVTGLSAGISTQGNTAGTTGFVSNRILFVGSNNITLSQSVNAQSATVTILGANTAAQVPFGVSAGTQSVSTGTLVFSDSNNITFGMSGSSRVTASASFAQSTQTQMTGLTAGISTMGNTSGTTGLVSNQIVFVGSNITLSQSVNAQSATLTISAAAPGGGAAATLSYFRNMAAEVVNGTATATVSGSTSYIQPFILGVNLSVSYARFLMSFGMNSSSVTTAANATGWASFQSTINVVVYTQNTGASSQSLGSYASGSAGITQIYSLSANSTGSQWSHSISLTHPITGNTSQYTTSSAVSSASFNFQSQLLSRFSGLQHFDVPLATSFSPGNYWIAYGLSSAQTTSSQTAMGLFRLSQSMANVTQVNSAVPWMGQLSNSSVQLQLGLGSFSTNAIGTTASLPFSVISSSASHPLIPIQFIRIT